MVHRILGGWCVNFAKDDQSTLQLLENANVYYIGIL